MNGKTDKALVAVFAHPDDEAVSCAGTLAKYAKYRDVYLICVTNGNDHTSQRNDLVEVRSAELKKSCKAIGIKNVFSLGYEDGELSNNIYHEVANKIKTIVQKIKPDTLLTMENRGISGHIDHIFVSMVATYVFEKTAFVRNLMYTCITIEQRKLMRGDYFIYVPEGYDKADIDLFEDITETWQQKVDALKAHKSQFKDVDNMLSMFKHLPKVETFIVRSKR